MTGLGDGQARRRIREDLDTTLVVEAAAGTGKTTELVRRMVALLGAGRSKLDHIAAVTFTEKAAGEMKLRLRTELELHREHATGPEAARYDEALAALETAHIGTIHGFCADLLSARPVEARVDPRFAVAPESETDTLLERAFDRWFEAQLAAPREGLRRLLRLRDTPREEALSACRDLAERRDFQAPWSRDAAFDRDAEIDALVEQLEQLGALAGRASWRGDRLGRCLGVLAGQVSSWRRQEEAAGARDHDRLERDLSRLPREIWQYRGSGARYGEGLSRAEVLAQRAAAEEAVQRFVAAAGADLAARLQVELLEVVAAYELEKESAQLLDYVDLLLRTGQVLRDDEDVRRDLQGRFTHLFVDEFQDTDPLQAEILLLLSADDPAEAHHRRVRPVPGKLFVVGDPKQAIYRFRRADVVTYQEVKRQLLGHGGALLHLSTSFRAVPAIQAAINQSFAPHMAPDAAAPALQRAAAPGYVPLEPFRSPRTGQPSLVALPVPEPYGQYGNITQGAVAASTPAAVTAFVDWLIHHSGWTVFEPDRRAARASRSHAPHVEVPIRARHVCLMFRRMRSFYDGDVTRPYVRGLEARRIPHVLVGGHGYHDREEVMALRAALAAIEHPDDELNVYATLRGPLLSLQDDALLAYRHAHHRLHPLRALAAGEAGGPFAEVSEALALLGRLHVRRNRVPLASTIGALLGGTRCHAGIAIWPTGEQALANLLRSMDEARRFELRGATSFRAFVQHLEREAERGDGAEASVLEEGTDGVRIMTVHKAKGLEFPVVVLCDPVASRLPSRPSRYVDGERGLWAFPLAGFSPADLEAHREEVLAHDHAEAIRVTYVAATRASDLLVVPAVGDEPRAGWVDVLHPALYPPAHERRQAVAAPGCPRFGGDTVLSRPASAQALPSDAVAPGLHTRAAKGHGVVWWDPALLELEAEDRGGLRQMELLVADEGGAATSGQEAHARWVEARAEALQRGALPSRRAAPVTQLSHADDAVDLGAGTVPARIERTRQAGAPERPHGKRFGTLVHALLEHLPSLAAERPVIAALATAHARLYGATDAEREAAVEAVVAALEHPLLVRARRSGDARRELPMMLPLAEGMLAEGIIDLAFREGEGTLARWTVVDFKTDAAAEATEPYRRQVAAYARAVAEATGEPAEPVLLFV